MPESNGYHMEYAEVVNAAFKQLDDAGPSLKSALASVSAARKQEIEAHQAKMIQIEKARVRLRSAMKMLQIPIPEEDTFGGGRPKKEAKKKTKRLASARLLHYAEMILTYEREHGEPFTVMQVHRAYATEENPTSLYQAVNTLRDKEFLRKAGTDPKARGATLWRILDRDVIDQLRTADNAQQRDTTHA